MPSKSSTLDQNPWESQEINTHEFVAMAPARRNVWDIQYKRILSVWPWMLITSLLAYAGAFMYLRYIIPVYRVNVSAVIGENQEVSLGQALFSSRDPLNNQIATLTSPTLLKKVVDSIGLQYHASVPGHFRSRDLYKTVSWKITNDSADQPNKSLLSFQVEPKGEGFLWNSGSSHGSGIWGMPFHIGVKEVLLDLHDSSIKKTFTCYETDDWGEAIGLNSTLAVSSSPESNVIRISLQDNVPQRSIDVLNALLKIYNDFLLDKKTTSISLGLDFIDKSLGPLRQELDSIETVIAQYKSAKGFIGTSANGAIYLTKTQTYDNDINQVELQKKLLTAVQNFIDNPVTKDENLSLLGVTDPYLLGLMNQYQMLRLEKEKLSQTVTEKNPQWQVLQKLLQEVRHNLDMQIENYKRNISITESSLQSNLQKAQTLLAGTPTEEKELLEQFRQRDIKLSLYQLLMQKKEEAAISLASVTVNTQVISPALASSTPVSPQRKQILLGAFVAGLFLPFGINIIREVLNNKMISKVQLEQMVQAPVVAELDFIRHDEQSLIMVNANERSIFGEQIRSLRASLSYYQTKGPTLYVLITSCMSGEGKSFISANLAKSFALQGKKTALLEFDLRRPKIARKMQIAGNQKGLVNVLIGQVKPEDIVIEDSEDKLFHLFPSGPIPPNPSELISSARMSELKSYLDQHYEVVVLDTPPYGIVADAQLLSNWANICLIITRFRLTIREQVHEIEEWRRNGIFRNMALVFNGISSKGYYGYKYGYYSQKRKYGYHYYTQKEEDGEKTNQNKA